MKLEINLLNETKYKNTWLFAQAALFSHRYLGY